MQQQAGGWWVQFKANQLVVGLWAIISITGLASAQLNLTNPTVVRGAIKEATAKLSSALKSGEGEALGQATSDAQNLIDSLETLGQAGNYRKELGPLLNAYLKSMAHKDSD